MDTADSSFDLDKRHSTTDNQYIDTKQYKSNNNEALLDSTNVFLLSFLIDLQVIQ